MAKIFSNKLVLLSYILYIIILANILMYFFISNEIKASKQIDVPNQIDVSGDPIQNPYTGESFTINSYGIFSNYIGGIYILKPVDTYEISATVGSKLPYHDEMEISPVDLCMAWGKMADDDNNGLITYGQSLRYCFTQYNGQLPRSYVESHVSNNHIIPANDSILEAIKSIKEGDKVTIKGYLVDVSKSKLNGVWNWRTSQTRFDKGSGACEIIYVTEVRKK
jgi:hypothetical protein